MLAWSQKHRSPEWLDRARVGLSNRFPKDANSQHQTQETAVAFSLIPCINSPHAKQHAISELLSSHQETQAREGERRKRMWVRTVKVKRKEQTKLLHSWAQEALLSAEAAARRTATLSKDAVCQRFRTSLQPPGRRTADRPCWDSPSFPLREAIQLLFLGKIHNLILTKTVTEKFPALHSYSWRKQCPTTSFQMANGIFFLFLRLV